jgi:type I restriction enzyme, S subunit
MPKPAPKPSALADLPQGWEIKKLEEITKKIVGGGTPSRKIKKYYEGSIPWVTVKDMKKMYLTDAEEHISELAILESASRVIERNNLILATRIGVGRCAVNLVEVAINQDLKALYPNSSVDVNFLLYWFLENQWKLVGLATGSTVLGINVDDVKNFELLLPPLLEQQRIASILSSVDALLERSRAVVTQLEQVRRGFVQHFLARGLSQSKNSVWPNVAISSVARVAQGYTFSPRYQGHGTGDYLYAKVSDMTLKGNEHFIHNAVNWVSEDVLQEMRIDPFSAGTIIFPRVGASLKTNKKRMLIKDSVIDDNLIAVIIEKKNLCSAHYFFEWLETIDLTSFCNEGPLPSITRSTIQKALLPLPPLEDQEQLIAVLLPFDRRIQLQKAALENLSTLKKALMQYLLTGKYLTQPMTAGSRGEAL